MNETKSAKEPTKKISAREILILAAEHEQSRVIEAYIVEAFAAGFDAACRRFGIEITGKEEVSDG